MHLDITTVLIRLFQIPYEILFKCKESLLLGRSIQALTLCLGNHKHLLKGVRSVSDRNSGATLVLQQKDQAEV